MYFEKCSILGTPGIDIFKNDGKKIRFGFSQAALRDQLFNHLMSKKH
jgi:hypothetical protein